MTSCDHFAACGPRETTMLKRLAMFLILVATASSAQAGGGSSPASGEKLLIAQVDVTVTVGDAPLAAARVALDLDGSGAWDEHLDEPFVWTGADGLAFFAEVVSVNDPQPGGGATDHGANWQAQRILTGNLRGTVGAAEVRFDFVVPPGSAEAHLGLYDLRGRRLAEVRGVGDLDLDVPAGLPAGIYFARLSAGTAAPVANRITSVGARAQSVSARRLSAAEAAAAGWVDVRPAGQKGATDQAHPINIIVTHADHGTVVKPVQIVEGSNSFDVDMADAGPADAMVLVPAGTFTMGRVNVNGPVHEVTLTRDFLIGRREVTNGEYLEALQWAWNQGLLTFANWGAGLGVMQHGQFLLMISQNDDRFEIRFDQALQQFVLHAGTASDGVTGPGYAFPDGYDPADHPVKHVTWYGAACYTDWRSQMEGLPPFYNGSWSSTPPFNNPYEAEGYRLPTEAEWEYAAQYNDYRWYPWGNDPATCERANHQSGSTYCIGWTAPVGSHPAGDTALGLQDMAGNVLEWVNDWASPYGSAPRTDPIGGAGSSRVARGGNWLDWNTTSLICARRLDVIPGGQSSGIGFRIARTRPPEPPEFIVVPAGTFTQGVDSPRQVTLTRDFLLGVHEVTNAQYREALQWAYDQGLVTVEDGLVRQHGVSLVDVGATTEDVLEIRFDEATGQFLLHAGTAAIIDDPHGQGDWGPGFAYPEGYDPANHPVKHITWYGAASYCDWRSLMEGLPPYYNGQWDQVPVPNNPYEAVGYRLPTEAEWEYAAQWNDGRVYPWGSQAPDCSLLGYNYCVGWTEPVGSHPAGASALGLQDMGGSVFEWCNDWSGSYEPGPVSDPTGGTIAVWRVLRGGGWSTTGLYYRCYYRAYSGPSEMRNQWGFRLCRTVHP